LAANYVLIIVNLIILGRKAMRRITGVDKMSLLSPIFVLDRFEHTTDVNLDAVSDAIWFDRYNIGGHWSLFNVETSEP
jgi:hypothetical protein